MAEARGFLGSATAVEPDWCIHPLVEPKGFLVQHKYTDNLWQPGHPGMGDFMP